MRSNGSGKEWIVVRQLIDGTGGPPRDDMAVAVADGRIVDVRPRADVRTSRDERVLDHGDHVLVPGLIDAHLHLCFSHGADHAETRGELESAAPLALAMRAVRNAQLCLRAGVTTVRDLGDVGLITLPVRDAIAKGWLRGPRVFAAGTPITTTGGHLHYCGCEADTADEVRKAALSLCKQRVDVVKVIASGALMTPNSNPFLPQYSAEELSAIVQSAHRLGRRVAAHSLCAEANRQAVAAEIDTIEHCFWLDPAGAPDYDAGTVETLVEREVWVVVTMAGPDRVLLPADGDSAEATTRKRDKLVERFAYHRQMWESGVKIVVASDAGARLARFEDFHLSLACAVEALGMSPVEAIHRSTVVAAQAIGIENEFGSIEVGKRADLLLVAGDPAEDVSDVRHVARVWQRGVLVVDGGMMVGPEPIDIPFPEEGEIFAAAESKPPATSVPSVATRS